MKKIFYLMAFLFIAVSILSADEDVIEFSIKVAADANLVTSGGPYTDTYWLETDGTEGIIVLRFKDKQLAELPFCEAPFEENYRVNLVLTIPRVADGSSRDGLVVAYGGKEIGRIKEASAGTKIEIPLDPCAVPSAEEIVLVLRGGGPDGLAVSSRASGAGAVLEVVVFGRRTYQMIEEEEVKPKGRQ